MTTTPLPGLLTFPGSSVHISTLGPCVNILLNKSTCPNIHMAQFLSLFRSPLKQQILREVLSMMIASHYSSSQSLFLRSHNISCIFRHTDRQTHTHPFISLIRLEALRGWVFGLFLLLPFPPYFLFFLSFFSSFFLYFFLFIVEIIGPRIISASKN